MIVYRCISEIELSNMLGKNNEVINIPRGSNTFKYEKGIDYKHFFYYYDSAISFMEAQNMDRYYDMYTIIMAYSIDEEILKNHFGLGQYNLYCLPKTKKDKLLLTIKVMYYPEFAIPSNLISNEMIVGIGNKMRLTEVSDCNLGYIVLDNQKSFLEYEKWLFKNGTNVSKNLILENKDLLFPIDCKKIIKTI